MPQPCPPPIDLPQPYFLHRWCLRYEQALDASRSALMHTRVGAWPTYASYPGVSCSQRQDIQEFSTCDSKEARIPIVRGILAHVIQGHSHGQAYVIKITQEDFEAQVMDKHAFIFTRGVLHHTNMYKRFKSTCGSNQEVLQEHAYEQEFLNMQISTKGST